jgi:hypothetical protein
MPLEAIPGIIIVISVCLCIVTIIDTLFAIIIGENARAEGIIPLIESGVPGT